MYQTSISSGLGGITDSASKSGMRTDAALTGITRLTHEDKSLPRVIQDYQIKENADHPNSNLYSRVGGLTASVMNV